MHETQLILDTLWKLMQSGQQAALATVVRTSGSTYRKAGAKMVISQKGEMTGSISAGCLEADVREVSRAVIETGKPRLLKYDNTASEDVIWGLGLGCNGIVEVLVESVSASERDIDLYQTLRETLSAGKPVAMCKVIGASTGQELAGAVMLVFSDGRVEGSLGNQSIEMTVQSVARKNLSQEKSQSLAFGTDETAKLEIYIESITPPSPLVIIGADPDARPIVAFAKKIGFKVILVDHRPDFASAEKYPEADEFVVTPVAGIRESLAIDDKTFVLVKTHNYQKDKEILGSILKSNARYVGQLGPKVRTDELLRDLKQAGARFSQTQIDRLYAPTGLDLGAESPEQIALSILAEMVAVRNGRAGGFLKEQEEAIHPPS